MLCQLLCLDRRYQRMNCFNVRELQALLKNRFFMELVNSKEQHDFLNQTAIGLRFKTNNLDTINPNTFLSFRYGVNMTPQPRFQNYSATLTDPLSTYEFFNASSYTYSLLMAFRSLVPSSLVASCYNTLLSLVQIVLGGVGISCINSFALTSVLNTFSGTLASGLFLVEQVQGVIFHFINLNEPL